VWRADVACSTNQYREIVALLASDNPDELRAAHHTIAIGCGPSSPMHAAARSGALDALRCAPSSLAPRLARPVD
jgi:hypothetical protein